MGKLSTHKKNDKNGSTVYNKHKINSKWVKCKTRDYNKRKALSPWSLQWFHGYDTKTIGHKDKNRQWDYVELSTLLCCKNSQQNKKATNGIVQNICKPYTLKCVNLQNI